jgi:hypothetical protein
MHRTETKNSASMSRRYKGTHPIVEFDHDTYCVRVGKNSKIRLIRLLIITSSSTIASPRTMHLVDRDCVGVTLLFFLSAFFGAK